MLLFSLDWIKQCLTTSGFVFIIPLIKHLPIIGSDHGHILIDTETRGFCKSKNFRFVAKWLSEDNFMDLVKSSWTTFIKDPCVFKLIGKINLLKKKSEIGNSKQTNMDDFLGY